MSFIELDTMLVKDTYPSFSQERDCPIVPYYMVGVPCTLVVVGFCFQVLR